MASSTAASPIAGSPLAASTIAAIASPPGPGARGVVRISGPRARELVRATWAGPGAAPDLARRAALAGRFDDGAGTQPLLLLWMPGPRSFTREDVAEFHLPGSPPLLAAALRRLLALGAVAARAGEFTRRAFESGRIDLTRAEGVLALVQARSEGERRAACALLCGGLAQRVERLREGLDELRALCEASLDFDESDTGHVPSEELAARAAGVLAGLEEALGWEERRSPAAGAPRVVLAGAPNAGKSALFNALVGEQEALVSAHSGTTRDGLGATWLLAGVPVRLQDTAGLERPRRELEERVQELARGARAGADLALWVVDATRRDLQALAREGRRHAREAPLLLVWNKLDLPAAARRPPAELTDGTLADRTLSDPSETRVPWVATSALTGEGLPRLAAAVARELGLADEAPLGGEWAGAGLERELSARHRAALGRAVAELRAGLAGWRRGAPLDLLAEGLRAATAGLDEVSGRTTPEDLLDRVFARFCIGK